MDKDFEFLKEAMAVDLANMLVEKLNVSVEDALDMLYNSETYRFLSQKKTGLYFQSPKYVYTYLEEEIRRGRFIADEI